MTALGVIGGGLLGGAAGASLDRADVAYSQQTMQRSLAYNQPASWQTPQTGAYGSVTPGPTFQAPTGQECREFQQTITVGGRTEEGYGRACRQPDGSWRIVR